jgi:hypothetical protein
MLLYKDMRIGGQVRYVLTNEPRKLMQIPSEVRKSVAFVTIRENEKQRLLGTAFFVSIPSDSLNFHLFAVTARHVIEDVLDIDEPGLRINLKDGTLGWIDTEIKNWMFHPTERDSVDVAVTRVNFDSQFDHRAFPLNSVATVEFLRGRHIYAGSQVFLAGLFQRHYGQTQNIPIIRVGNIAAIHQEKVKTKLGMIDAHLIEARSIGGLSGSPVFVYTEQHMVISDPFIDTTPSYYLLGLVHGHWDVDETKVDVTSEEKRVNMGIAIVVPVEKILEVLNQPKILEENKRIEASMNSQSLPIED